MYHEISRHPIVECCTKNMTSQMTRAPSTSLSHILTFFDPLPPKKLDVLYGWPLNPCFAPASIAPVSWTFLLFNPQPAVENAENSTEILCFIMRIIMKMLFEMKESMSFRWYIKALSSWESENAEKGIKIKRPNFHFIFLHKYIFTLFFFIILI